MVATMTPPRPTRGFLSTLYPSYPLCLAMDLNVSVSQAGRTHAHRSQRCCDVPIDPERSLKGPRTYSLDAPAYIRVSPSTQRCKGICGAPNSMKEKSGSTGRPSLPLYRTAVKGACLSHRFDDADTQLLAEMGQNPVHVRLLVFHVGVQVRLAGPHLHGVETAGVLHIFVQFVVQAAIFTARGLNKRMQCLADVAFVASFGARRP